MAIADDGRVWCVGVGIRVGLSGVGLGEGGKLEGREEGRTDGGENE